MEEEVQEDGITEWFRLEGISQGHLAQTPCSSRGS